MNKKEKECVETVWTYYRNNGRYSLPWRNTRDPYNILVSEMMLQQTQVERVIPKYTAFLKKFSTVQKLAKASLRDVLILWQGLGYNRRAKMLHRCAQIIVNDYKSTFPTIESELQKLPGIGTYTSAALVAFAYNTPTSLIETNIRTVYLHHFFGGVDEVTDAEILKIIGRTADTENPREWYYALMDYGSYLKKEYKNTNTKSAHYTKQSVFKDSDRQIRGAVIRLLTKNNLARIAILKALPTFEDIRVDAQIEKLQKEGMIIYKNGKYCLP